MSVSTVAAELTLDSLCAIFPWIAPLVEDDTVTEIMIVTTARRGLGVRVVSSVSAPRRRTCVRSSGSLSR